MSNFFHGRQHTSVNNGISSTHRSSLDIPYSSSYLGDTAPSLVSRPPTGSRVLGEYLDLTDETINCGPMPELPLFRFSNGTDTLEIPRPKVVLGLPRGVDDDASHLDVSSSRFSGYPLNSDAALMDKAALSPSEDQTISGASESTALAENPQPQAIVPAGNINRNLKDAHDMNTASDDGVNSDVSRYQKAAKMPWDVSTKLPKSLQHPHHRQCLAADDRTPSQIILQLHAVRGTLGFFDFVDEQVDESAGWSYRSYSRDLVRKILRWARCNIGNNWLASAVDSYKHHVKKVHFYAKDGQLEQLVIAADELTFTEQLACAHLTNEQRRQLGLASLVNAPVTPLVTAGPDVLAIHSDVIEWNARNDVNPELQRSKLTNPRNQRVEDRDGRAYQLFFNNDLNISSLRIKRDLPDFGPSPAHWTETSFRARAIIRSRLGDNEAQSFESSNDEMSECLTEDDFQHSLPPLIETRLTPWVSRPVLPGIARSITKSRLFKTPVCGLEQEEDEEAEAEPLEAPARKIRRTSTWISARRSHSSDSQASNVPVAASPSLPTTGVSSVPMLLSVSTSTSATSECRSLSSTNYLPPAHLFQSSPERPETALGLLSEISMSPKDITALPDVDRLTSDEQVICRVQRIDPARYLHIKTKLFTAFHKTCKFDGDGVTINAEMWTASKAQMVKTIDVNKISKIYYWYGSLGLWRRRWDV